MESDDEDKKPYTDLTIRKWIRIRKVFEGRSFGNGLYLRYRIQDAAPVWRFRYRFNGKQRVMNLGGYTVLSLADAKKTAKTLSARVALGFDVADEKQERIRSASAKIDAEKNAVTVSKLADEYFQMKILGHWKHPNIVRSRIENDIKPKLGKMKVEDVRPRDIDAMLQSIVKRRAPTVANDVLRLCKKMFNHGVKRHYLVTNPAATFDNSDAGGKEEARNRWLTQGEIISLFQAMRDVSGRFTIENHLAVRLLLLLAVRKEELTAAPWREFDLDKAVWHLPETRTKTSVKIDIPLPPIAVDTLRELRRLSDGSDYVFPARKMQTRMVPHISPDTINAALSKHVKPLLTDIPPFTIHDFRRTARTHLAALGTEWFVGARCLNHKIGGVEGIYDQYDYFAKRKEAFDKWAVLLSMLEAGKNTSEDVLDYAKAETSLIEEDSDVDQKT